MAPTISRREQVELDELLSDIYRGIETLPDHSNNNKSQQRSFVITRNEPNSNRERTIGRAYVREFEVPESSALVQQHRQALSQQQQPQRSTLKRQQQQQPTGGGNYYTQSNNDYDENNNNRDHKKQTQSLASFLNANPALGRPSATPENKRRVRILDHKSYTDDDDDDDDEADYPNNTADYYNDSQLSFGAQKSKPKKERVKYVNTNKLIYHDEPQANGAKSNNNNNQQANYSDVDNDDNDDEDDDIDGVTRVEYYHTTWLDKQLGRASKRRSSKELNERQVKEKAMIEELKRSLKNGAITLRQSLKGGNNKKNSGGKNRASEIFDDQLLLNNNTNQPDQRNQEREQSKVVKTGIATLPRHHHNKSNNNSNKQNRQSPHSTTTTFNNWSTTPKGSWANANVYSSQRVESPQVASNNRHNYQTTKQTSEVYPSVASPLQHQHQQQRQLPMQTTNYKHDNTPTQTYSSRTLPHNKRQTEPHQLLQSHYRGNLNSQSKTLARFGSSPKPTTATTTTTTTTTTNYQNNNTMRNPAYSGAANRATHCASPSQQHGGMRSPLQQQNTFGASISSVPSASEVVRSALSRSNSQLSVNQLNKTINQANTPITSPMTPTHQLKPSSPSLSPSPTPSHQYTSKTLGHQQQQQPQQSQYLPGQIVLHGTRTVGRPPQVQQSGGNRPQQQQQQQQQHQQQQQLNYANPHASLMQHRMEQQSRQPNRNTASIREFNELDSLLRSLSPGVHRSTPLAASNTVNQTRITPATTGSVTTQIMPGYSNQPAQPSFGGYMPANYQQQQQQYQPNQRPNADIYAKVQRPPVQASGNTNQPFIIDVTDKKTMDENCVQRQRQDISEFEPTIDLLPTMEDYQNIAKLNPVKNHYWYKPQMGRDRAINLLKDKPQGTFIVRDSTSFKGAFGLAVKVSKLPKNIQASLRSSNQGDQSAEYIRHFLIEPVGAGVRLKGYANEPVFDSLSDLIYQHSLTELALPCRLIIPRADIEDPQFNHKQRQFFDEFVASKEQARHQPYERTSPDGGYRRYPGDVLVHNEHRIIFE